MNIKVDIKKYKSIIFDCDGVLINSNLIKSDAFHEFGMIGGEKKAIELMKYHKINGGISRFEKIKYFYKVILKKRISNAKLIEEAKRYGDIVTNKILSAEIADGLEELRNLNTQAEWSVVSGGDQEELRYLPDTPLRIFISTSTIDR